MNSQTPVRHFIAEYREIARLDREIVRKRNADRIAARFEAMNVAQARKARRQMRVTVALAAAALVTFFVIFHDVTARTAAIVLEAEAQGAW